MLILLFFCLAISVFSQKKIKMEGETASLEAVVQYLEAEHGFLFSYKNEDLAGVEVALPTQSLDLGDFLTTILQKEKLEFEIVDKNYIILRKADINAKEENVEILLCGKVVDEYSNNPLEFANVYMQGTQKGVSTNKDGSFQLKVSSLKNDTLIISYVGYENQKVLATDFQDQPCQTIALSYFEFAEDFIVIKEYLTDGIDLTDNGAATELQPNRIGALPGQVEPDVMKTIQFLPGVVSSDGSVSNLNVRGGTSDQNLVLWEDIPMYHTAHYFGMISAFNPYIIKKASVYRGGFDADYGGRISSVIDLRSDDVDMKENQFDVGVNFLNAFASGKVKLLADKAMLIFSLRSSYAGIWRSPTFESITRRIHQGVLFQAASNKRIPDDVSIDDEFNFLDNNLKFSYRFSEKDEISIAYTYTQNEFNALIKNDLRKQTQIDSLNLKNKGLSVSWKHDWSEHFSTQLLGIDTDYGYDYEYELKTLNENGPDKAGVKTSGIKDQQIHLINKFTTRNTSTFKVGYLFNHFDVNYQIQRKDRPSRFSDASSDLQVLYATFNSPKEKRIGTELGFRANYFHNNKEKYFEPRLRVWFNLTDHLRVYGNSGRYYQFVSQLIQLRGDDASIETPVWVMSAEEIDQGQGTKLPVLTSDQHQVGIVYKKQGWLLDVQSYLKDVKGLTSLNGFNDRFSEGNAKIKGVDVLLKKRWKPFTTWASFSLSRSDHYFKDFFESSIDNFSDSEFSAPNDIRSVFHWVTQYRKGPWEYSLGWKLTSGSPYSLKENFVIHINPPGMIGPKESIRPIVNNFNSERLPSQHQLDASVVYNIAPANKKWKTVLGLSLYNIYNQTNIYNRSLFLDNRPMEPLSIIYTDKADVRFTPNVVVRVNW